MKYLLLVALLQQGYGHVPVAAQFGPFNDIIACEQAAARYEMVVREKAPRVQVATVCVGQRQLELKLK